MIKYIHYEWTKQYNPLIPVGNYSYQFFICCPRDCVSRHNGGTSGAPFKPLRDDSALKAKKNFEPRRPRLLTTHPRSHLRQHPSLHGCGQGALYGWRRAGGSAAHGGAMHRVDALLAALQRQQPGERLSADLFDIKFSVTDFPTPKFS